MNRTELNWTAWWKYGFRQKNNCEDGRLKGDRWDHVGVKGVQGTMAELKLCVDWVHMCG